MRTRVLPEPEAPGRVTFAADLSRSARSSNFQRPGLFPPRLSSLLALAISKVWRPTENYPGSARLSARLAEENPNRGAPKIRRGGLGPASSYSQPSRSFTG
jgi:hypothetical protein